MISRFLKILPLLKAFFHVSSKLIEQAIWVFWKTITWSFSFDKLNQIIRSIYSLYISKSHTNLLGNVQSILLNSYLLQIVQYWWKNTFNWFTFNTSSYTFAISMDGGLQRHRPDQNVYNSTNKNIIEREFRPLKITPSILATA